MARTTNPHPYHMKHMSPGQAKALAIITPVIPPNPSRAPGHNPFDLRGYLAWESGLKVGDPVFILWTNSNNYFSAHAVVTKSNQASLRARLTEDAGYGPTFTYPKGREISVPRFSSRSWSHNNGAFPARDPDRFNVPAAKGGTHRNPDGPVKKLGKEFGNAAIWGGGFATGLAVFEHVTTKKSKAAQFAGGGNAQLPEVQAETSGGSQQNPSPRSRDLDGRTFNDEGAMVRYLRHQGFKQAAPGIWKHARKGTFEASGTSGDITLRRVNPIPRRGLYGGPGGGRASMAERIKRGDWVKEGRSGGRPIYQHRGGAKLVWRPDRYVWSIVGGAADGHDYEAQWAAADAVEQAHARNPLRTTKRLKQRVRRNPDATLTCPGCGGQIGRIESNPGHCSGCGAVVRVNHGGR